MVSKNELKVVKSLKVKKYRAREKRFIVEGSKNVLELLESSYEIDLLLCSKDFLDANQILFDHCRVEVVNDRILSETSSLVSNKVCLAVVKFNDTSLEEIALDKQIFVLDGVGDPGNLGTIIRTLDWFGFNQIVCSQSTAELYNPKTIGSTMGSFTRMKTYYGDLNEFLESCPLTKYGAQMNGMELYKSTIETPSLIVMGSESHGISEEVQNRLDHSITIPKFGSAESLNVGIATGLIAGYLRMA